MSRRAGALRVDWDAPSPMWLALGATAFVLAVGLAVKGQCVVNAWAENFQYRRLCYNDIQPLYGVRGISRALVPYRDVLVEYPVLTGMFMDAAGRVLRLLVRLGLIASPSDGAYFVVSALGLAPFAFAVTLILRRTVPARRLMVWAAGTPLLLYAFHNWDLIAVLFSVWGLAAFERDRDGWSGSALALGAAAKLYPAFLLPGLVIARLAGGGRKAALRLCLAFAAVFAAVNVPWTMASGGRPGYLGRADLGSLGKAVSLRRPGTNGWAQIWLFHAERYPDFGTVWYWVASHLRSVFPGFGWDPGQSGYRDFVSWASLVLFAAGSALVLAAGLRRRSGPQGYPAVAAGLGVVAMFLLFSKVHSPQYALWIAPLLALVAVPWRYVVVYLAADLAVFVSGFYYFTVMNSPQPPGWMGVLEVAVWARAGALAGIIWCAFRAVRALPVKKAPAGAPPVPGRAAG